MRTHWKVLVVSCLLFGGLVACSKEHSEPVAVVPAADEVGSAKSMRWPRFRFRFDYNWINGCSGGECGSCVGMCCYWPIRLGKEPSNVELLEGIGRAKMTPSQHTVFIQPIDLPMDPGTGKVILKDELKSDAEVARELGFTEVTLLAGEYTVDYSSGAPYGVIEVEARLVP